MVRGSRYIMPSGLLAPLLVFVGGGFGSLLRYLAALAVGGTLATLTVNVAGCFAIGLIAAAVPAHMVAIRLFFLTGLLGGFTTFSAFGLDAYTLWHRGEPAQAALYVAASLILSLGAVALGFAVARSA